MTASAIVSESRTFTPAEVDRLAAIGGGGRAVPEMLLCAALWALIRRQFPDAVQESQHLTFRAPAETGVQMRLELEVVARPAADLCDLALRVIAAGGVGPILDGRSRIRLTGGSGR